MSAFTKIVYSIIAAGAMAFVATSAFAFFDVGFETYGSYLLWLIALVLLYAILPGNRENVFAD